MSRVPPLASIVISCFDQSRYAYDAVASGKSAYGGPLQVVIVDRGDPNARSRRQLEEVAESARDARCRIEIAIKPGAGPAAAYNEGLGRATGEFIQLLDGGDLLLPGKLDDQILHFQVADALDVSISDCLFANESLDVFSRDRNLFAEFHFDLNDFAVKWARGFRFPIHCALFRREIFAAHRFERETAVDEEWLFWVRLAAARARIAYLGGPGALRRTGAESARRPPADSGERWRTSAEDIGRIVAATLPNFLADALEWRRSRDVNEAGEPVAASDAREERPSPMAKAAPRARAQAVSPRMSVVIPVHEHYEYLERCLASVGAQLDDDIEVVIVDDGSRDPRVARLLTSSAGDLGAKLVLRQDNRGVAATLDEAVARAEGEFIAFLDCDDTLPPEALPRARAYLEANPDCDYLFTDRYDISENDKILRLSRYGGYGDDRISGDFRRDLLNGMVASHLKVIRRASIARVGGFEVAMSGVQDWVLALQIAEFGRFGYLPEPLYNYRVHSNTVTRSDPRGQARRANQVRRRFAERYFQSLGVGRFADDARAVAPLLLTPAEISLRRLCEQWSAQPLIAAASADSTAAEIGQLREFNSYFDKILWTAPEIPAALVGYLWSPDLLQRA